MNMRLDTKILKKTGLFSQLTDAEIEALIPKISVRGFEKGQAIFDEGEDANSLFIIISGGVLVQMKGERGDLQTIAELESGEHFGELPFFDRLPRVASAVSDRETVLAELPYSAIEGAATASAETGMKLYHSFARALCERMRMTNEDLADFRDSFPFFAT